MKKRIFLSLLAAMLISLCACGQAQQPEAVSCGHEAYSDLITSLEKGDYALAHAMIDAMEGTTEPVLYPEAAQTMAPDTVVADIEMVELTGYNVRDYFEFAEEFHIGEQASCTQYIRLKEEYQRRLLSVEDVILKVSCLRCEAYGSIDLEEEEFRPEYYEPLSREKENRVLELDHAGSGWLTGMTVYSDRGCFPDYVMDVDIESGAGTLVLSLDSE